MSQSALLVGLLALAFVLYLAARGRLTTYTGVLWGKPSAPESSGGSGSSGGFGDLFSTAASIAKYAPEVLAVVG